MTPPTPIVRVSLRVLPGLVLLVAAVIALAPAACLDRPLALHTQQRLRLADTQGYWWRGRGVLSTADGAARLPVAWRVAFAPLVTGALVVELHSEAGAGMPTGTIEVRGDTIDVRDGRLTVPAAIVRAFVPGVKTFAVSGDIDVHASSFRWRNGAASGALEATWRDARVVAGAFAIDLGIVSIFAAPAGNGIAGTVRNAGGEVTIDGTVSDRAGVIEASLGLKPASGAPELLRTMLPLLGPGDGAGGVRLAWRGER